MDQTTINLLVPGLVAITVFLFFAAGIILAKRGGIRHIPPENQYDTRLASIYSELRGLAITLEGLIVLLGVVAAVLLYGNAYLVMAAAIVISLAEFSKIKAAESLAWSPRLSNLIITLFAILASSIFTGESLLNINTEMQNSINGKLESAESKLIKYKNDILQKEKEINISRSLIDEIEGNLGKRKSSAALEINKLVAEEKKLRETKDGLLQGNNFDLKNRLQGEIATLELRILKLQDLIEAKEAQHTQTLKSTISARNEELSNAPFFGSKKSSIERSWDEHLQDMKARHSDTQLKNIKALEALKNQLSITQTKLNNAEELSKSTLTAIAELDPRIDELVKLQSAIKKDSNFEEQGALKIAELQEGIDISRSSLKTYGRELTILENTIVGIKEENQFYKIAAMVLAKKAGELSTEEVKKVSRVVIGITGISLALIPTLLMLSAVMVERSRIALLQNKKDKKFLLELLSAAEKFLSYGKARRRWKRRERMDRQSLEKRAAKEIEKINGKMQEAIERAKGESQKAVNSLEEIHVQDSQKIQSLELDRRELETKIKAQEATIKDLRKKEKVAEITKAKQTNNGPNNIIKRVPRVWFNELYKK